MICYNLIQMSKDKTEPSDLKKVILKGVIPVDEHFPQKNTCKVYESKGEVFSATLNQSNLSSNNNKFYIMQLLQNEASSTGQYILYTRWGRVGYAGKWVTESFTDLEAAVSAFQAKRREKKRKGSGYTEIELNYEDQNSKNPQSNSQQAGTDAKSTLPSPVQGLIKTIFDFKMMSSQMKEIGYDAKKMPLGKLSKNNILKGYDILKNILEELDKDKDQYKIKQFSSQFYTLIPHDFGFKNMNLYNLSTPEKVKEKLEMLQSLEDIRIYSKIISETGQSGNVQSKIDQMYRKLNTKIVPLARENETFKLINQYAKNTHSKIHSDYQLEIRNIFEIERDKEYDRYTKHIGNKQLLWHGSRLTNFVGILSQGLRIAPPQAPSTGYMFGKGVYFADMISKSANYCQPSRRNTTGFMLLCQVALGKMNQMHHGNFHADRLPPGFSSTKGCGKIGPHGGKTLGEMFIPCGKSQSYGHVHSSLIHNEYIVYDIRQILCRYLLQISFKYLKH